MRDRSRDYRTFSLFRQHQRPRRFTYELLERRDVFSCDLLGHLTGTTFLDRDTDGTFEPSEALSGVQLQLFVDSNDNGLWDVASDTLQSSTESDGSGVFQFGQLAVENYLIVQPTQVVNGIVLDQKVSSVQTISRLVGTTIDDFNSTSGPATASRVGVVSDEVIASDSHVLGLQRDLAVIPAADATIRFLTTDGGLETDSSFAGVGSFHVTWDGHDEPNAGLQENGLQQFDLTEVLGVSGRAAGICMEGVQFDHPGVVVTLRVYTDDAHVSAASIAPVFSSTPGNSDSDSPNDYFMSFVDQSASSDFRPVVGNGANFQSVGAVTLEVTTAAIGTDGLIDQIVVLGAVTRNIIFRNELNPETELGTIAGTAWDDINRNGIRDTNEPVQTGVPVQLIQQGAVIIACTTDLDGHYAFDGLLPGQYTVRTDFVSGAQTSPLGQFDAAANVVTDPLVRSSTIFDWRKDGDSDLALVSDLHNRLLLFSNDGNGNLSQHTALTLSDRPHGIASADLDHNGLDDLVVTLLGTRPMVGPSPTNVAIFFQQTDGTFVTHSLLADDGPTSVVLSDFNDDGWIDIATANRRADNLSIFENLDGVGFTNRRDWRVGQSPLAIAAGDLDGDGRTDLLVANYLDDEIVMLANLGDNTFSLPRVVTRGIGPAAVAVADIDSDGHLDAVASFFGRLDPFGTFRPGDQVIMLYQRGGSLVATNPLALSADSRSDWLRLGDIDADGDIDLAVLESEKDRIATYLQEADHQFSLGQPVTTPESPEWMELGFLNADGHVDMVAPGLGGTLSVFLFQRGKFDVSLELTEPIGNIDFGLFGVPNTTNIVSCNQATATTRSGGLRERAPHAPLPTMGEYRTNPSETEVRPLDAVWARYDTKPRPRTVRHPVAPLVQSLLGVSRGE